MPVAGKGGQESFGANRAHQLANAYATDPADVHAASEKFHTAAGRGEPSEQPRQVTFLVDRENFPRDVVVVPINKRRFSTPP